MKKSKIGEGGFHLIEEGGCVHLMYKGWYVLRLKRKKIELATDIFDEPALKTDEKGRVKISDKTC